MSGKDPMHHRVNWDRLRAALEMACEIRACTLAEAAWAPEDAQQEVHPPWGAWHQLVAGGPGDEERLTIAPSLACRTCPSHGWIRDGHWVPA